MYMSNLSGNIKYWSQILTLPLYWLSHLMPRDKNIWVFGSTFGKRFADNPRYFYLYMTEQKSDKIKAVWISKNKTVIELLRQQGYNAYYLYTLGGIYYSLRAKVYLYDNYSKDICFLLSGGAKKINMWHGVPLKKINMDNIFDKVRHPENQLQKAKWFLRRLSDEKPSHYVLTTSEYLRPIFSSAFATQNVIVEGYPRNDVLIGGIKKNILSEIENYTINTIKDKKKDHKIILYMPTFRDSEKKFFDIMDMKVFNKYLEDNHFFFCVKLHPKSKLREQFANLASDHIFVIDPLADPYSFLAETDLLLTDYSSIYFDYLYLNKPIIFFNYDLKEYLSGSRELYFNYEDMTPGIKVSDMKGLMAAMKEEDCYAWEREFIRDKIFEEPLEYTSERLYHHIKQIL